MVKFMARQGDVLIEKIKNLPKEAVEVNHKGLIILAEGEVTGHAHKIKVQPHANRISKYFDCGDGVSALVVDGGPVVVEHEEHAPIQLDDGVYKILRQKEYSPQAIRSVAD